MTHRSEAATQLAHTGRTQEQIAGELEADGHPVSRAAVGHWLTGATRPKATHRTALRARYAILECLWDQPARGTAAAIEHEAHKIVLQVSSDPAASAKDRAELLSHVAVMLSALSGIAPRK